MIATDSTTKGNAQSLYCTPETTADHRSQQSACILTGNPSCCEKAPQEKHVSTLDTNTIERITTEIQCERVNHLRYFVFLNLNTANMAPHSSVLAWRIPGTEEPGGLPSTGSQSGTRLKRLGSSSNMPSSRQSNLATFKRSTATSSQKLWVWTARLEATGHPQPPWCQKAHQLTWLQ